jgi:hypothetical protein
MNDSKKQKDDKPTYVDSSQCVSIFHERLIDPEEAIIEDKEINP